MCGICGVVDFSGRPTAPTVLKSMADTLQHRGPDAEGFYFNEPKNNCASAAIAHRRLSIIDISSGQQPLANEDQTVWIAFNGEIYNYHEIRSILVAKGHIFRTQSDTEVIVHAYEEWGEHCVNHLRGMFAFAIWDDQKQNIFLARDRLGIKPLYYFWDGTSIVFGSELKAILAFPGIEKKLNLEAVQDYFTLLYIPAPKSIFKDIYKLEAGHVVTLFHGSNCLPRQYWDLHFHPDLQISEVEWQHRILNKLDEAIRIRLMSEVPLGAFLSGGVDSSAVVALMAGLMDDPVKTNAIGFQEDRFNELPFAHAVARQFQTDHFEQTITPDSLSIIDTLAYLFDEPFADSSSVPTYYVSGVAKQKVTVCLSGDGGDENFAGYRRYYFDHLENRVRSIIPGGIRRNIVKPIAEAYPKFDWAPQILRAKTLLTNLSLTPVEGYFNSMSWFQDIRKDLLPQPPELAGYNTLDCFHSHYSNGPKDRLSAVQYLDVKTYLVDDILTKVDRASMGHALEVRVPILDHEFMELVATIPSSLKLKGKQGKYIFKKALNNILSNDVLCRKKQGFSMPVSGWFKNELKPLFQDSVLSNTSLSRDMLSPKVVNKIWKQHQTGQRERGSELWAILMFEKWMRQWA